MKRHKILITTVITAFLFGAVSCKKELEVGNPNSPSLANAQDEPGILALASGGIYQSGFNGTDPSFISGQNWLGDSYFSIGIGFHELLGDNISAEASNQNINVVNLPDYAIFDDKSKITNSSPQKSVLKISNSRDKKASNPFFYEWAYMYSINNVANQILSLADKVTFSGDAATKVSTLKAWAYWWKGFAYSKIGSLYYAGLITNSGNGATSTVNSNYVNSAAMITEANKNLDQAASILNGITKTDAYNTVMGRLIPDFVQVDNGSVPTPTMWIHNINTLKARNLLVNKKVSDMTSTDWNTILTLTNAGIQQTDNVFAGRTTGTNGFFSSGSGSVAAMATGLPKQASFKISERLIQNYNSGDKRLANNFKQVTPYLNQVGGFTFSTRWQLLDGGAGLSGVSVLSNKTPGEYEIYIAGSYEENELMKAEALIYTGNIASALKSIDNVRAYQGAGLTALSGQNLSQAAAVAELRKERRVALVFRGLAFYDARRYGIIYDVSKGGGLTNAVVVSSTGVLNTNVTINYNFLDYWDVPADEAALNPPGAGSAPIVNPN